MKMRLFSRTNLFFLFFMSIAFTFRAVYLRQTIEFLHPGSGSDSYFYLQWAMDIVRGNIVGKDVFYALPVYPYFLSLAYLYAGGEILGLAVIQILIGSINCGLIYILAKRFFNQQVGFLAGLISCVYFMFIFYDRMLLPTALVIFLGLVLTLSLLAASKHPSWKRWVGCGFLLGIATLSKASFGLVAILSFLWFLLSLRSVKLKQRFLYYLCFVLPFVVLISATTLRNYLIAKDPVLITAHSGINFYIGNNPQANGLFKLPLHMRPTQAGLVEDAKIIAQSIEGRALKGSEVSNFWVERAFRFIRQDPGSYLRLLGKKLLLFWNNQEYVDDIEYYIFRDEAALSYWPLVHFAYLMPLAFLGLFLAWPMRKQASLIYVFVFSLMLGTILFFINARYRVIVVPYLIILAAFTLWRMYQMYHQKQYKFLAICLVFLCSLYFVGKIKLAEPESNVEFTLHYNKGVYLTDKKDYFQAKQEFNTAIRLNVLDYMSYLGLGNVYYQERNFNQAIAYYGQAIEINPYFYEAAFNIGFIYSQQEEYAGAEQQFKHVLQINPDYCAGYYNLGRVYQKQGFDDKALEQYGKALLVKPGHTEVLEAIEEIKDKKDNE